MDENTINQTDERLTALEVKVSYLEDFLNQIQEVAVGQSKEIQNLKAENKILAEKVKELADITEGDIPNRRPPHY